MKMSKQQKKELIKQATELFLLGLRLEALRSKVGNEYVHGAEQQTESFISDYEKLENLCDEFSIKEHRHLEYRKLFGADSGPITAPASSKH